jgi:hypothetical protein
MTRVFSVAPAAGFGVGTYLTEKVEVRRTVSFPVAFQSVPYVWGRGEATVGCNQDEPNYALGFCELVPSTDPNPPAVPLSVTGCTLRTFVYRYTDGVNTLGWFPVAPGNVVFAYTTLGQLQAVDSGDDEADVASIGVRFSVENPVRGDGVLFVSLPQEMHTALRIFNVAGGHVATLQQGRHGAGRHEIRWTRRTDQGNPVPSGMYLAKFETPQRTLARKLLGKR